MSDDLISRQDAIEIIDGYMNRLANHIGTPTDNERYAYARGTLLGVETGINALPSAQLKHKGEWIRIFNGDEWYWFCSNCKEEWYEEDLWMGGNDFPNFCPNCGARMEKS